MEQCVMSLLYPYSFPVSCPPVFSSSLGSHRIFLPPCFVQSKALNKYEFSTIQGPLVWLSPSIRKLKAAQSPGTVMGILMVMMTLVMLTTAPVINRAKHCANCLTNTLSLSPHKDIGTIIILICKMRKLRLKEVQQLAQDHTFNKRQRVASNLSQIHTALNLSPTTIHTAFLIRCRTVGMTTMENKTRKSHYYIDLPYTSNFVGGIFLRIET